MQGYMTLAELLRTQGLDPPDVRPTWSFMDLLEACRATYLTDGLQSLKSVPVGTVDFAWSHAVLEHIALSEFDGAARELHRVLRASGVTSHRIDLQDHLSESLHSLRFPERIWESWLF